MIGTSLTHKSLERKLRFRSTKDSGNTGFSPFNINGVKLWLDASKITGLSDGSTVSNWLDQSGFGNGPTQGTTSAMPLYKTNIKNGLPIVRFDGADDQMTGTIPTTGVNPFTAFAVASMRAQTGNIGILLQGSNATTAYPYFYREVAATVMRLGAGGGQFDGPVTSLATFYVFSFVYAPSVSSGSIVGVNGVTTTGTLGTASNNDSTYVLARWTSGGPQWHQWDIGEMLWYDSVLSTTNRRTVEAYLGAKWGITVS